MKRFITLFSVALLAYVSLGADGGGCDGKKSSDQVQQEQQETLLKEGTSQIGMPAIKNFRERKLLKDILEMRDQENLTTYTYIFAENTGKLIFLGRSIGFGIPYATQFTNPQKIEVSSDASSAPNVRIPIPQADPNGLFSPSSAEGTWIMLLGPDNQVHPVYIEPRVIVSPFPLNTN